MFDTIFLTQDWPLRSENSLSRELKAMLDKLDKLGISELEVEDFLAIISCSFTPSLFRLNKFLKGSDKQF
jgi:hypothetical protein